LATNDTTLYPADLTQNVVKLGPLVGASRVSKHLFNQIRAYAQTDYPVLITGESGTGKELVAQTVHSLSLRRKSTFIPVNCGSLGSALAGSELFGHVRGAFTGADRSRKGAFSAANGGTLFLDEFGELTHSVQATLLRALETGEIRAVGADSNSRTNIRLICATNVDLWSAANRGDFRDDLLFRVDVLRLHIPPLRDRLSDLDALVPHLLERLKDRPQIDPAGIQVLKTYHWPGNVRELRNVLTRCAIRAGAYRQIEGEHVADVLMCIQARSPSLPLHTDPNFRTQTFETVSRRLRENGGDRRRTYQSLGIPRSTFYRWLREGKVVDR